MKLKMQELEEEEIVLKAQNMKGNQEEAILAFNELIRRYYNRMLKMAYMSLNYNIEDAEDVVQMVVTEIFCKIEKLNDPKVFKTWMYTILYNKMAEFCKGKNRRREVPLETYTNYEVKYMNQVVNGLDEISKIENKIDFRRKIEQNEKLNNKEKITMILRYGEGLSTTMISKLQNMNENTVKTNLFRARNKIKEEGRDG